MNITYREQFKIIVYLDGNATGAIKKHPTEEKYRYVVHGGGGKGEWFPTIEQVKQSIEGES